MANNKTKPLLTLSTEKFIACIEIDGNEYGLLSPGELTPKQQYKMSEAGKLLSQAGNMKKTGDEERCKKALLEMLLMIMPDANRSLLNKLSVSKSLQIVNAYLKETGMIKKKVMQLKKGTKAKKKKR